MNIFSVPDFAPDIIADLDTASVTFAQRLSGLGNAVIQVLSISGDGRAADIALFQPFLVFITEAYGNGFNKWQWDTAAGHLRDAADSASTVIADPTVRSFYIMMVTALCDIYESVNSMYWDNHFVDIPPGMNLPEKQEEAVQELISEFTEFQEQCLITDRGGGVKELTIIVMQSNQVVAQLSIIADPNTALVVMGFIGEHIITVDDYNPYVFELLKVFQEEGIGWPPAVV